MRTLDLGFKAHIESGATTLATCWRIARTDGVVLGFTDHDAALTFAGTTYEPMLEGGEASQKLGPQTDTSEVVGVLTSGAITEDDILLGRFDGASVETWRAKVKGWVCSTELVKAKPRCVVACAMAGINKAGSFTGICIPSTIAVSGPPR